MTRAIGKPPHPMPKLKRKRQIRTCEYCYHHKLKCDRNSPCSTCVRTKNDCIYQFQQLPKDYGVPSEIVNGENESKADDGKSKKKSKENAPKVTFKHCANDTPLYYSRAFYPYLEPSLNRMLLFKMSDINEGGLLNHDPMIPLNKSYLNYTHEELVNDFPTKKEFDDVIYLYWEYVHPLVPVIDKDLTMERYQKFWEEFYNSITPEFDIDAGTLFLAMLYAIKKAIEVNEKDPKVLKEIREQKNRVYNTFEKFKLAFNFISNASLSFIQASIIMFQCGYIYYVGIFPHTASVARQAEYMGLHRDPLLHDVHPKKAHVKDAELRRISWNFIRFLDTATSITAGMSPHMIMTNSSTRFPSKRDFNPETQQFDGEVNPFMIFHITRFKCSLVMETISHYLNSDFSSDQEKILRWEGISRTATALYQDINILVKEIFSCSSNPKYSHVLLRWLVSNTAIIVHRTFLLLLACDRRPYSHQNRVILKPLNKPDIGFTKLSQANTNKEFFEQILTVRMPYSAIGVEVCMLLLYETKIRCGPSPELNKFRWFARASNPFQYIFFILRDIYHSPSKIYDFTHIPPEIRKFIFDDELLNCKEEARKFVIDASITALYRLEDQWPDRIRDMMDFLVELRKFVYRSVEQRINNFSKTNFEEEDFNCIDSTFELDKYRSIYNIISNLNEELSPYSENSNSSKEAIKTDSNNLSSREISMSGLGSYAFSNVEPLESHQNKTNSPSIDSYSPFRPSQLQPPTITQSLSPGENQAASSVLPPFNPKRTSTMYVPHTTTNTLHTLPLVQKMQNSISPMPSMIPVQSMTYGSPIPSIFAAQSPQTLPLMKPMSYMQPIGTLQPTFSPLNNNNGYSNIVSGPKPEKKEGMVYESPVQIHPQTYPTRYRSANSVENEPLISSITPQNSTGN